MRAYRSNLECRIADQLYVYGINYEYESEKLKFVQPEKNRVYTPDFILKKGRKRIYIEAKGEFTLADRQKMLWIKEQHPRLDIRMVFGNAKNKIRKGSKTTYADWCDKHGYMWATGGEIPREWLREVL